MYREFDGAAPRGVHSFLGRVAARQFGNREAASARPVNER